VLEGLDLEVQRGQISVVLGGSGCGKSTLLRILLGLESYDAGSVKLFGDEVSGLGRDAQREAMMHVGMLFQGGALFDSMTVGENVAFVLRHVRHLGDDAIRRICRDNLLLVGLKNVEGLYPSQLSGGMRKRVALARAIAHEPELLFVDEPTAGLDPVNAGLVKRMVREIREAGATVFLTTHDMQLADQLCDRVAFIDDGSIRAIDSPRQFKLRYGRRSLRVEVAADGGLRTLEFPLEGLGANAGFLRVLREEKLETLHTQETTLEQVFIEVTGRALS
jgi:fluoroquinolone transport system ATP-binding protein